MKLIIHYILLIILYFTFVKADVNTSSSSKINSNKPLKMTFRNSITFTPFELKFGYLNYGGKNYWYKAPFNKSAIKISDLPVILDSTQANFDIINELKNRRGIFIELDLVRTNFPKLLINQNYIDFQFGIGVQYIDFSSNPSLPSEEDNEWIEKSSRGEYFFHPRSTGININSTATWQFIQNNATYIYHSFGLNSTSLYQSEGGEINLSGQSYSESFGIGSKYIFDEKKRNFNYTIGIELKWNRLYMNTINAPDTLSPISGIDLRSSGIFLTTGIQFGGLPSDGDIAYYHMMNHDYISASESFEYFLAKEKNHGKRKKALEMLEYCESEIPQQQLNIGIEKIFTSNFNEAVEWFNQAESKASGDLIKKEIQLNRKKIAQTLLDSVQNYKSNMSIDKAQQLALFAQQLSPDLNNSTYIIAQTYVDKGKLNQSLGNFSHALKNYKEALLVNPSIEPLLISEYKKLINAFIKDAYDASVNDDLFLAINSLKSAIEINPNLKYELENLIIKLEEKLKKQLSNKKNVVIKDYIKQKQHPKSNNNIQEILIGMSTKDIQRIKGKPEYIDKTTKLNIQYQMWSYPKDSSISRLYFKNNILIKIEK